MLKSCLEQTLVNITQGWPPGTDQSGLCIVIFSHSQEVEVGEPGQTSPPLSPASVWPEVWLARSGVSGDPGRESELARPHGPGAGGGGQTQSDDGTGLGLSDLLQLILQAIGVVILSGDIRKLDKLIL